MSDQSTSSGWQSPGGMGSRRAHGQSGGLEQLGSGLTVGMMDTSGLSARRRQPAGEEGGSCVSVLWVLAPVLNKSNPCALRTQRKQASTTKHKGAKIVHGRTPDTAWHAKCL
jgi:hypothetical protein